MARGGLFIRGCALAGGGVSAQVSDLRYVRALVGGSRPQTGIKNLKYGERFSIQAYGQTYVYEVRENTRLWGSSVSKVFKHEEYDWVTLLTCEGYNPITGKYFFRRMVRAVLVEVK